MRRKNYILFLFMMMFSFAEAQDSPRADFISMNIDSLIADSIKKEYIRTHVPLTMQERNSIILDTGAFLYGKYLRHYMQVAPWYATLENSSRLYVSRRVHASREWILYLFMALLFFFGFIHASDREYVKNIFRVYFNQGFIFRQTKEQLQQSGITSLFFNFLFIFSAAVFFFFGTGVSESTEGWDRLYILGISILAIVFIYAVKFIFLTFVGWLFDAKETFGNYIFIVFLNAKIAGMLMLGASMLIAVSDQSDAGLFFKWISLMLMGMIIFRSYKGYSLFSREVNLPVYIIACLALEILPIAILFKFLSESYELLVQGMM
ncbi:MAG: DUF4271 domain-containing protein [Chitinophagia bacterium]|jgi:hypothetical protein